MSLSVNWTKFCTIIAIPGITVDQLDKQLIYDLHKAAASTNGFWLNLVLNVEFCVGASDFIHTKFYPWVFHECGIPIDEQFTGGYPLLWDICSKITEARVNFAIAVLNMKAGAKTEWTNSMGTHYLLEYIASRVVITWKSTEVLFLLLIRRLLDAGARFMDDKLLLIKDLSDSRLSARAAALALLVVAKRRGDLRGIVARELWWDMAERVWEKRWEFK